MRKYSAWQKVLALTLTLVMVLGMIPATAVAVEAGSVTRVADTATYDGWKDYFPTEEGTLHTKDAGAVWTDKSVFEPDDIPAAWTDVSLTDTNDNFLVALSALAANKIVKGYSNLPTDTMLVLDVSGSMNNGENGNRSADEMVEAANAAIDELLELNLNNRVGVVLYSGNSQFGNSTTGTAEVILPLDRYTTTAADNQGNAVYLNHTMPGRNQDETVSVNSAVRTSAGSTITESKNVEGGTYIQNGIWQAAQELLDADTTVSSGVQEGVVRMPIMVLMSDGAPTVATNAYTAPGTSNRGDGGDTDNAMGFLTQLTAAYAWANIEDHYGRDGRFYTLGLGVAGNNVAEAVLDPANETTTGITNYWRQYLALDTTDANTRNDTMDLDTNYGNDADTVRREMIVDSTTRYYVTKYYEASGSDLGQSLLTAFDAIVDEIVLQSRYYPTLVDEGNPDVDGYVTFRDEIGLYMEVTDIKGIRINGVLHTGELLAENFVTGGGNLGTLDSPTDLGDELVWAVQKRLGIADVNEARALLSAAYEYGQLSYTGPGEFSNYIGWFGDENEQFVDFWYEGMPENQYPENAYFINKSYGFLGDVDTAHGIAASDMMYTMVRVRERIKEDSTGTQKVGEVIVDWSIPAALIPTITYVAELNGETYDSGVKDLTVEAWKDASGNTVAYAPMRLMYEVALRSDINELNVVEKTGGQTTFYTNAWNSEVADTSVNTFSHFEPSVANERFYFTENQTILVKDGDSYVPYTGSEPAWAENTYYSARIYFDADAGVNGIVTTYELLTETTFGKKVQDTTDNTWYIPSGTIHRYYHDVWVEKTEAENKTDTLGYSLYPYVQYQGATGTDAGHYYMTSTLGNNGKLTVTPATGILLTKELAADAAATTKSFTFEITGGSETAYTVTPLNADGTYGTAYTVTVTDGKATVSLKPGETVYVTGMTGGVEYTITEQNDSEYSVESVLVNGTEVSNPAEVTPAAQTITPVVFTNAEKGEGGLYITKEVTSATSYPDAEFELTVTLEGNANEAFVISSSTSSESLVAGTDYQYADGVISGLKIKHGQTIYISGLTEGTTATVTETTPTGGFALDGYTSINYSGDTSSETNDGVVTIHKDLNATVVVKNTYTAAPVDVTINFNGTKNFDATELTAEGTNDFTFELQKWDETIEADVKWKTIATKTVTATNGQENALQFAFDSLVLEDLTVGTTSYQIVEVKGANEDITYDRSVYTFSVVVTDDGDGTLSAEVVPYEQPGISVSGNNTSGWTVDTTFTNEYHTAATNIDILKSVTDKADSGKTAQGFVIESWNAALDAETGAVIEDENGVWTVGSFIRSIQTDALGEARLVRNYDNTDFETNDTDGDNQVTYYFIITEKHGGETGWSYDNTQYQVTVELTKDATTQDITANFSIEKVTKTAAGAFESITAVATNGDTATITFSNEFDPEDVILTDLNLLPVVNKTLTGKDMEEAEFKFEIVDASGTVVSTGYNTIEEGKEGWVLFDKQLTFSEVGTYNYKIREVPGENSGMDYDTTVYDMVVTVTEQNGELAVDYFFEDATTETVTFENTYKAEPTSLALQGTKTLTGGRHLLSGEFHFDLVEMTDSTFQTVKENGVTLTTANIGAEADAATGNAVGKILFESIPYDTAGTYYYKVTERSGGLTDLGVTYSTDVAHITVTVTDDTDAGVLVASASYTMQTAGGTAMNFVNTYKALPASTNFAVSKELEGKTLSGEDFTFGLYEATVEDQVWEIKGDALQTVKNEQDGTIGFEAITYANTGTYYYIVKEIAPEDVDSEGNKDGVHYDSTEYRVTIEVTDNWRGRLEAKTTIVDQNGTPYEVMIFHNTYTISGEEGISLSGVKTLDVQSGALSLKDDMFTFVITDENGEEVSTTTNKGNTITFEELTYTADDCGNTYSYTITEKEADITGLTCSDAEYTLDVTVYDEAGKVVVEYTLTDAAGNAVSNTALNFTNVYNPAKASVTIQGSKTLTGATLAAGAYTFDIYSTDSTFAVKGEPAQSATNAADGSFSYSITELDVGTYYYVVKERIPANKMSTITYDESPVQVTVQVTDTNGVLKPVVSYTKAGAAVQNAAFTNIYTAPAGVTATIYIQKNVVNKTEPGIGLDGFTFILENGDQSLTVQSDKDGKAGFQVTFGADSVGKTYELKISEKKGSTAGMTYDKTVHTVTVQVGQNADGTLSLTVNGKQTNEVTLSFTNTYEKNATPVTGDSFPIILVGMLLLLSAAGIVVILISKRSKNGKYAK